MMAGVFMDNQLIPPGMRENKMAVCMGTFFVGNMVSGGLTKTNAFEIYLNDRLLWSTLKTQRKPTTEDLVSSFRKVGITIEA